MSILNGVKHIYQTWDRNNQITAFRCQRSLTDGRETAFLFFPFLLIRRRHCQKTLQESHCFLCFVFTFYSRAVFHKVQGPLIYSLPLFFTFFNFAHCFPAVILPTIPIELVNEVYNVKYQRRGVAPRKESRIGFARRLSRIISQVNEQRSLAFCNGSLSVRKEAVVRMSLMEALVNLS